jgi:putative transposase
LPARGIIRVLNCIVEQRGKPEHIRSDNGPEFISQNLQTLGEENQIEMKYIQPGKPTKKLSLNGKMEVLEENY